MATEAPIQRPPSDGCPLVDFHPLRWEDVADPHPALKQIRAQCPVVWVKANGMPPIKMVTRFELASRIYRDPETFGNMGISVNAAEHASLGDRDKQIIATDPPRHGAMRRFALLALSPDNVDQYVDGIAEYAKRLTESLPVGEMFDLMEAWAVPIPSVATAHILGLPEADALEFRKWVRLGIEATARRMSPSSPEFHWTVPVNSSAAEGGYGGGAMFPESADAVGRMVRARRADPVPKRGDLLDKMLDYVDPETGITFSDEEVIAQLVTLIAAGNDTTAGHIGNLVYRMLTIPGLWDQLQADRSLIPRAIEESLRLDPPQLMFPRIVREDVEVDGVTFERGEVIIISIASGNRDESVYGDDVDRFDMFRKYPNPRHLAMGRGIHTCIGAYQARKIAKAAVESLLDRVAEMRIDPDYRYEKNLFHHFRVPQRLPVTIERLA